VNTRRGSQFFLQEWGDSVDEFGRGQMGLKEGQPTLLCPLEKDFRNIQTAGDDDTSQFKDANLFNHLYLPVGREVSKVGDFGMTDNLKAFRLDKLNKACQRQSHLLDLGTGNPPVHSPVPRPQGEVQRGWFVLFQFLNRKTVHSSFPTQMQKNARKERLLKQ
jgi:hypothetical protein